MTTYENQHLETFIFFLSEDGQIRLIPSAHYVALLRSEQNMKEYSGQQVRVADLYVSFDSSGRAQVENETYTYLQFTDAGFAEPPSGNSSPEVEQSSEGGLSWLPTNQEHSLLQSMICDKSKKEL